MRLKLDWEDVLSSFRNGVIPSESVQFIAVGRDYELQAFEEILIKIKNSNKSVTKFLNGDYGDGKSYILKVIDERAYDKNFVVSSVTITPNISFNNLEDIYASILRNLRSKNGNSFSSIVNKWITKLNNKASKKYADNISKQKKFVEDEIYNALKSVKNNNPTFANVIQKFYEFSSGPESNIAEYGLNWLCGDKNIDQSVKRDFCVSGYIDNSNVLYYLETLSIFFNSIGFSGFVVLFDECEVTMNLSKSNSRETAYNNIREIYDDSSKNKYKSSLFVFAGVPLWFDDISKGIQSYPALYTRIRDPVSTRNVNIDKPIVDLNKFNKDELMKLSRKLLNLYEKVYGKEATVKFEPYVGRVVDNYLSSFNDLNLRDFIREFIGYLDVIRQDSSIKHTDILDLIEGGDIDFFEF